MILGIYVMRDVKTGFLTPSFDSNDQTAIRNFAHAVCQPSSILAFQPKDFSLYKLGEYDTDSGFLNVAPQPIHLYEAADALRIFGGQS